MSTATVYRVDSEYNIGLEDTVYNSEIQAWDDAKRYYAMNGLEWEESIDDRLVTVTPLTLVL